jgi:hypothetical protein
MPTDPISELANQFQAFISTKHPFASDLDPETLQSIESFAPPSTSSPGSASASTSQERRFRSDAQPPNSSYPVEWAESRTHLRSAVRHFQNLLKRRSTLGLASVTSESSQSHANFPLGPINTVITEVSRPLISTAQAPGLHQTVNQDTTTMSGSSDSSPRPSDNHQELHQDPRQEIH